MKSSKSFPVLLQWSQVSVRPPAGFKDRTAIVQQCVRVPPGRLVAPRQTGVSWLPAPSALSHICHTPPELSAPLHCAAAGTQVPLHNPANTKLGNFRQYVHSGPINTLQSGPRDGSIQRGDMFSNICNC